MPLGIQNWVLSPVRPTSSNSSIPFQPFISSDFHRPFSSDLLFLCPVYQVISLSWQKTITHSFEFWFLPPNDLVALCKTFTPRNCFSASQPYELCFWKLVNFRLQKQKTGWLLLLLNWGYGKLELDCGFLACDFLMYTSLWRLAYGFGSLCFCISVSVDSSVALSFAIIVAAYHCSLHMTL